MNGAFIELNNAKNSKQSLSFYKRKSDLLMDDLATIILNNPIDEDEEILFQCLKDNYLNKYDDIVEFDRRLEEEKGLEYELNFLSKVFITNQLILNDCIEKESNYNILNSDMYYFVNNKVMEKLYNGNDVLVPIDDSKKNYIKIK